MPVQYNFLTAALDCFIPPHTQPPLGHRNPIHLLCLKLWSNPPLWVFQFIAAQRRVKFYFLYIFLWEIGVVTKNKYALREALNWEKKYFLWNHFVNGGGSDWFHTSILFFQTPSKHTSNTLKHPSSTLKTPINTLQTAFKVIFFFDQKMVGKKNRDFIKGGRGWGHHLMKWFHKKSFFFTIEGFP